MISLHYTQAPEVFVLRDVPYNSFCYESGQTLKTNPEETITELNKILSGWYQINAPQPLYSVSNKPQIEGIASLIDFADFLSNHPWVRVLYNFEGIKKTYNGSFLVSKRGISDHLEFDDFASVELFSFTVETTLLSFIPPENGTLKYTVVGELKSL